jgi:hypothetical protein
MRWLTLGVEQCDSTGELGFKIRGMKSTNGMFVGSSGLVVAHDIVEHVNGLEAIGTIGDELMALGGIWRCRGQWGDIVRGTVGTTLSPEQHVAGELPELYHLYRSGVPLREEIPVIKNEDEEDRELFERIVETAKPMVRGNWDDDWDHKSWVAFCEAAVPLMMKGAIKFTNRWEDDLMGNSQFWSIHYEVQTVIDNVELHEGQIWKLGYGQGQAKITGRVL